MENGLRRRRRKTMIMPMAMVMTETTNTRGGAEGAWTEGACTKGVWTEEERYDKEGDRGRGGATITEIEVNDNDVRTETEALYIFSLLITLFGIFGYDREVGIFRDDHVGDKDDVFPNEIRELVW